MPAYIVVDIEVQRPAEYERYKELAPPSIARYGGRYLARGGATRLITLAGHFDVDAIDERGSQLYLIASLLPDASGRVRPRLPFSA